MLFDSLPIEHVARPPKRAGSGPPPMLLMLHGVGSNERDLLGLADELDARFYVLSLRGPVTFGPGSYGWFEVRFTPAGPQINPEQAENSRQNLVEFIQQAPDHYKTDAERVVLFGFSQGAIMSLTLALTRPDLLSGVVAISGRTLPELFEKQGPLGGKLAKREAMSGLPILVGHGRQDNVLPIQYGRQTDQIFSRLPFNLSYREYDMGHGIGPTCLEQARIWLSTLLTQSEGEGAPAE